MQSLIRKTNFLSLLFAFLFLFTAIFCTDVAFAAAFPDLEGHWAEAPIAQLIADGTINGYEDGLFHPEDTVTRAEFVKMIGKGPTLYTQDFPDVPSDHWAYDYVMSSGLDAVDGFFLPDTPITRQDVLTLIWKRGGSVTGVLAPAVITSQSTNPDAAAWAYTNGILCGDNGLNLRLSDTLTRAEAAALVVRARELGSNPVPVNFVDTVSPEILETVFLSYPIFDRPYAPDETVTNGEMARAALRLGAREYYLTYKNVLAETPFAHEYARDLFVVHNECLGDTPLTEAFADVPATVGDTLAELVYNAFKLSTSSLTMKGEAMYSDASPANRAMERCLSFACEKGVFLYGDGRLEPDRAVTMKDIACMLLQIDHAIGTKASYSGGVHNETLRKDFLSYPANAKDYMYILEGVDNAVYEKPLGNGKARSSYINTMGSVRMFTDMLQELQITAASKGAELSFTFYPSLVCDTGSSLAMRVKLDVLTASGQSLASVFGGQYDVQAEVSLNAGDSFFVELVTDRIPLDLYIDSAAVRLTDIFQ